MLKFLVFSVISMVFLVSAPEVAAQSESAEPSDTTVSDQKFVPEQDKVAITAKGNAVRLDGEDLVVKRFDLNKDGNPDIINVFKKVPNEKTGETPARIYLKIMDLNHDSRFDLWRFFDIDSGAVLKEELDLDFDGKIDRTDYYINGVVRRSEFDFQFDEKTDIVKSFDEKGAIVLIESDQNGDGKVDYWEFYKNGVLERMEKDMDNDGKSDVFKRPGDTGFTGIVDIDARFEIPEEPAQEAAAAQEAAEPAQEAAEPAVSEETKAEENKEEPKAEEAKPEENKEEPKAEEAKPEVAAEPATEVQPENAENTASPDSSEQPSEKAE